MQPQRQPLLAVGSGIARREQQRQLAAGMARPEPFRCVSNKAGETSPSCIPPLPPRWPAPGPLQTSVFQMFVLTASAMRARARRVAIRCCPTQASPVIKIAGGEISLQRPKTTLTKSFKFAAIFPTTAGTGLCAKNNGWRAVHARAWRPHRAHARRQRCMSARGPSPESTRTVHHRAGDVHDAAVSEHVCAAVSAGESVTVLSFGARATGKTTTMRSRDGVVLRAATDVFAGLGVGDQYMVTVSCLISAVAPPAQSHLTGRQVTHEILLDGMLPQGEVGEYRGGLHVREHPTRGFFVEGLSEVAVDSLTECEDYLRKALANCAAEEARCGSGTAGAPLRVHCLFTIRVRRRSGEGESVSDVQILDLAGWVRDKPAGKGPGAAKGPAAVVGEDMVVKAFQRIVSSLDSKAGHIPYRDSKMTRLLQPALGGHALCIPLVHIAVDNYEETEAMLSLATKLGSITCSVRPNLVDYDAELAAKRARVEALCSKLGRRPQGLKSSDIILGMNSSDDLLELRDTLASMELQQRDGNAWAQAQEASRAFKADGGAAACAARVDRKPKKDSRFKEVTDEASENNERAHAQLDVQRCLPPARGHANNTPRAGGGGGSGKSEDAAQQASPEAQSGRGDVVLQRRNRDENAERGGGHQAPSKAVGAERLGRAGPKARAPIAGGNADSGGQGGGPRRNVGGGAPVANGDMESITARLAKMQQHRTPVRSKEGGADGSAPSSGGGGVVSGSGMAERLALLKQNKSQVSRLRSMS